MKPVSSATKLLLGLGFLLLLLTVAYLINSWMPEGFLSLEHIKGHRRQLLAFIHLHYTEAVFCYIGLNLCTSLFLPGALALTLAGGMMFGTVQAAIYLNIGATSGAVIAFLTGRFVIGDWIQRRFKNQLSWLNREIALRGHNYLLVLRILPIIPHFAVNFGAGITQIPLRTYIWTTSLGMIPGSLIFAFIGNELRTASAPKDLLSVRIILALAALALLALAPVIWHHLGKRKKTGR